MNEEPRGLTHSRIMGLDTYVLGNVRVAITKNFIKDDEGRIYTFAVVKDDNRKSYQLGDNVIRVSYDSNQQQGNQRIEEFNNGLINIIIGCGNSSNLYLDTVGRKHDAARRVIKSILEK